MLTIWKFPLTSHDVTLDMPRGADLLTVQEQNGTMTLWARVEPANAPSRRRILMCGTGHEAPHEVYSGTRTVSGAHIATVQQGPFVWHFFDMGEAR